MGRKEDYKGIIDFLYKDFSRIDSFYAQINRGFIQQVVKSSGLTKSHDARIKGSVIVAEGSIDSSREASHSIEQQIDPHDQRIIELLESLNLKVNPLSELKDGQLVLIKGQLAIRNYNTISHAIPELFAILQHELNSNKKELRETRKMVEGLLKLVPVGIEMELTIDSTNSVLGILNENYMSIKPDDLLRLYGNNIPGEWFVIGTIDTTSAPKAHLTPKSNDIRQAIDEYAEAIRSLYSSTQNTRIIVPILIFRELLI